MDHPDQTDALEEAAIERPFLSNYLLFLLASTSASASEEFHATVRANGLRVPEWRVLACLHEEDGQMVTRLAPLALAEQSRLTRIIMQMDARGLVERRSDPEDRRRVRIYLTDEGRALAEDMIARARDHEAELLSVLPAGKGEELRKLLKEVHAKLTARD
ncbi:MarR family winged helix-turn-helix transcriptional regulator [Tropicimonas sp. IMCC34011]|uniref:MarR family winged helix-turn-helix transcriptional regulator n=1 Tax=Tropicimonas sp. IMCC34011 TaxID=2248759 RepID=UPI000E23226A|nr:MarR family transcriptional regulator [Tropicimonas sp. IMCC34011]